MLTYPWKCTVLHCNHLGNTWKPLVLMIRHFDYCLSASEGDNQSVKSSAPVVSRCFPGGYNVKLYISRGRLAWWLLAFLWCDEICIIPGYHSFTICWQQYTGISRLLVDIREGLDNGVIERSWTPPSIIMLPIIASLLFPEIHNSSIKKGVDSMGNSVPVAPKELRD